MRRRPLTALRVRARTWWETLTFGAAAPRRRIAALGFLGTVSGVGEAGVVVLLVALASRGEGGRVPFTDALPESPWTLAALGLVCVAVLAAAHLGSALMAARAAADVTRAVQTMLIRGYLDAPAAVQVAAPPGELQDLVTTRTRALAMSTKELAQAVAAVLTLAVLVVVATIVSPWTTGCLFLSVLTVLLVARRLGARRRQAMRRSVAAGAALATSVTETAAAARDLRVFGVAGVAADRLAVRVDEAARRGEAQRAMATATGPLTRDATVALLLVCVALLVTQTGVSLAVLGATVVLVLRALSQLQTLATVGQRLAERDDHVARVLGPLEAWRPPAPRGTRPCPPVEAIELRGASYTHAGAHRPALDGVDLRLERGELVGVVGRTGAGKSTLASLVLGLLTPGRGSVTVGGIPLEQIDPADWHARTAWVGQDPHLLTGTVAENIRCLRDGIGDDAVSAAALAAGLGPELAAWPRGLDHRVGAAGSGLSGGQRQRIALARALAGSPDVLVLDEPTSALDAHAEEVVRSALAQARDGRIVVVIAHRLSTVRACDRIAVLEAGRLTALARGDEIAANSAYYREVLALSAP